MPDYKADDGCEDRDGEMTGAITVNMVFTMLPVTIWSFFIGPWLFRNQVTWTLVIAVVMAAVLPFVCLRPSRWVWAKLSDLLDRL